MAAAVAIFITEGVRLNRFEYLDQTDIQTDARGRRLAEEGRKQFEPDDRLSLVLGVFFCILAVVPLLVSEAFAGDDRLLIACMVGILLALVALGVFLLVRAGMIRDSFEKLLETGNYTREQKRLNRKNAPIAAIYWGLVTAGYLAWSFITSRWDQTWVVWPVAGVLFGVVAAAAGVFRNRKKSR